MIKVNTRIRIVRATTVGVLMCGLLGASNTQQVNARSINRDTILEEQYFIENNSYQLNYFVKDKIKIDRNSEYNRQTYADKNLADNRLADNRLADNMFDGNTVDFPERKEVKTKTEQVEAQTEVVTNETAEEVHNTEVEETYNTFIINECGASQSFINSIDNYWNMIPNNIRDAYINSGSTITVKSNLGYLGLSYIYGTGTSTYANMDIDYRNSAKDAIVHEIGHYVCWYVNLGYIDSNSEFYQIWNEEYTNILTIDNTHINNVNTAYEYFAESFAMFILKPNQLRQVCPRTAEFVQACINSI